MPKSSNTTGNKFRGYVNVNLSVDDAKRLNEAYVNVDVARLFENVSHEVSTGLDLKLKVSRKDGQESYMASFMDNRPESKTGGKMLTAWSGDPVGALLALMYKHQELLDGDWNIDLSDGIGLGFG